MSHVGVGARCVNSDISLIHTDNTVLYYLTLTPILSRPRSVSTRII